MPLLQDAVYDILNMENIESRIGGDAFPRARRFFHDGSVLSFRMHGQGCSCKVAEDALYAVEADLTSGDIVGTCSCGQDHCAHLGAALLTMRSKLPPRKTAPVPGAVKFFRDNFNFVAASTALSPGLRITVDLRRLSSSKAFFGISLWIEGVENSHIMDPEQFLSCWAGKVPYRISGDLRYDPARWRFSPQDEDVLHYLRDASGGYSETGGRFLYYNAELLTGLLVLLDGSRVAFQIDSEKECPLAVDCRMRELIFTLDGTDEGGVAIETLLAADEEISSLNELRLLPGSLPWGILDGRLVRLRFSSAAGLKKAMSDNNGHTRLVVPRDGATFVLDELLPFLHERGRVSLKGKLRKAIREKQTPPGVVIRVDMEDLDVRLELLFRYGNKRVEWSHKSGLIRTSDFGWQRRDYDFEQDCVDRLTSASFVSQADGAFLLQDEGEIFRFIYDFLPSVQKEWDVLHSNRFKKIGKKLKKPSIGVKLTKKYNFMELKIATANKGVRVDPLAVLDSAKTGNSWVRLKDGQYLPLSDEQAELLRELAEKINFRPVTRAGREILAADPSFAPLAAEIMDGVSDEDALADPDVLDYSEGLVSWKKKDAVPDALQATLRDYQVEGFSWLANIYNNGLGGVLADDMGLGKTIQTITLVLKAVEQGEKRPFLVVCPSSLAFNWMNEVAKFAPSLEALSLSGGPEKRQALVKDIPKSHFVVISYALMQRDQESLEKYEFAAIFLDEAQHIKNPGSGRTKSAKAIRAVSRFALTGTPIENSLGELWSLFDFVLPGYLFGYRRFKEEIERPIMESDNPAALDELRRRIAPFMLRRTKKDVLKQLPKKTEQVSVCSMYKPQREAYLSVLAFFDTRLLPLLERDGVETHSLEILAALTRLRQICCHPGLALEKYKEAGSGKMDLLFEILNQAVDGGHKTLIFSQFTGMLDLIEKEIRNRGLNMVRLDGGTTVSKRGKLVDQFNEDPTMHAFLISLKAGGTGLNLTSADTVIHVDPWWNPAAEDQASARAYRMGQKNPVNVYKLIAENSVEEKILRLQQDKKRLFNAVVGSGGTNFNKFSLDQIRDLFKVTE